MLLDDKNLEKKIEKVGKFAAEYGISSLIMGFQHPGDPKQVIWRFQNIQMGMAIQFLATGIGQAIELELQRNQILTHEERQIFLELAEKVERAFSDGGNKMNILKAKKEVNARKRK